MSLSCGYCLSSFRLKSHEVKRENGSHDVISNGHSRYFYFLFSLSLLISLPLPPSLSLTCVPPHKGPVVRGAAGRLGSPPAWLQSASCAAVYPIPSPHSLNSHRSHLIWVHCLLFKAISHVHCHPVFLTAAVEQNRTTELIPQRERCRTPLAHLHKNG